MGKEKLVGIILVTVYILYFLLDFIKDRLNRRKYNKYKELIEENNDKDIISKESSNEELCKKIYEEAIRLKGYVSFEESGYSNWREWYHKLYLNSPHWMKLRREVLKRADYKCQVCGERVKLNIHHNYYGNIGKEKLSDLVALCDKCHKLYHKGNK